VKEGSTDILFFQYILKNNLLALPTSSAYFL